MNDLVIKNVGIIGLGYVGLPLAMRYCESGFSILGFDIDKTKVDALNSGQSYIKHIDGGNIRNHAGKLLNATCDFSRVSEVDAVIICVPTPLGKFREPDLSYVINTVDEILPYLKKNQVISLESTTYPGTTDELLKTRIESAGFEIGKDIFLVYSPEREDPGNVNFKTQTIPKVVGGVTKNCLTAGIKLYEGVIDKLVPVSSTKTAEMTKLLENIHRAVNIGLVNEMKIIADKMGVDIYEVIDAAATKPFGFVPYYPGPGLGGHCIPIDPFYLTWKAREYEVNTRFIELAGEVNSDMPNWVISKVADALNSTGRSIKGSKILVLGIAYKKNVDDMRESPSVKLIDLLLKKGAVVDYSDPWIPVFPRLREYFFDLQSIEITSKSLKSYDLVLLATDHDIFDYELIGEMASLIVDTRGRLNKQLPNLVRA